MGRTGQFYANGVLMDNSTLGVGWTKYNTRALYLPYDITDVITPGANVVGAMLGHGWKVRPLILWHRTLQCHLS
jgi:hypothetical protein